MKKLLLLCVTICTNLLIAQGGTVNIINSPLEVEVGQANTFTFVYNPIPPTTSSTTYSLNYWTITAPISGSSAISGNINGQNVTTYQYTQSSGTNVSATSPSVITATITFGDQAPRFSAITPIAVGQFKDINGLYTGIIGATGPYAVRVHTIKAPTISPTSILDCSNDNVQICASDYDDADSFTWIISGGTIISGQGSSCITVTPNVNGNITATCLVKRINGLSNYTATSTKIITRSARSISFVTSPANQDYICRDAGLVFKYPDQSGLTNVTWNAPNCNISAETIVNGIRQVTIYPTTSATVGSTIAISAVANFIGGCTATSTASSFKVLSSTVPPTPAGYFNVTLPENESSICTATTFNVTFTASNGFNNGITTVTPAFIWGPGDEIHYRPNKATPFTVCNKNLCTGVTTCKVFNVFPPAPCAENRIATIEPIVSPNPSTGVFKFTLGEISSGNYQIFDQNSILLQESKFSNQTELQIDLSSKSKSGIYILKVVTEKNTFTEKIIISDY
jgi:hypothetical protein